MRRIGNLRFNLPQAVDPYYGVINATVYGPNCPQQMMPSIPDLSIVSNSTATFLKSSEYAAISDFAEDCEYMVWMCSYLQLTPVSGLSLNVIRPAGIDKHTKLPVVAVRELPIRWSSFLTNVCPVGVWWRIRSRRLRSVRSLYRLYSHLIFLSFKVRALPMTGRPSFATPSKSVDLSFMSP